MSRKPAPRPRSYPAKGPFLRLNWAREPAVRLPLRNDPRERDAIILAIAQQQQQQQIQEAGDA